MRNYDLKSFKETYCRSFSTLADADRELVRAKSAGVSGTVVTRKLTVSIYRSS